MQFRPKHRPEDPQDPQGDGRSPADSADASGEVDQTAALIEQLEQQNAKLAAERDEAQEGHRRALADFQNYQRRSGQNEQQAKEQAIRSVLGNVMSVIDHFDMALNQDPAKVNAAQILAGVAMVRDELLNALQANGVGLLRPARNDEFDPTRHEAVTQQAAEGVEPGHIVQTTRPGYTVNERVVRPAQVIVAPKTGQ